MSAVPLRDTEMPAHAPDPRPVIPAAPASRRRRLLLPLLLGGATLVAGGWGVTQWRYLHAHESTDNAQIDGHIVPVLAKVGGYVHRVDVSENQHVDAGAPLVQLEDAEYRVRLAQAEAELAAARAAVGSGTQVGQAEAQVRSAASQAEVGHARVEAARAALAKAEADLRRYEPLAAAHALPLQTLDAARTTVEVARAELAAAERQTAASGAGVTSARAGIRLAEARQAGAIASRDAADLQLSYTRIAAPTTGLVAKKSVEVGQLVQPGQTLLSVVADSGIWVTANFKETQLADLRVGQPVEIDVDAYRGAKVNGVVESIGSATGAKFALLPPDNATGNFTKVVQRVPVRIRVLSALDADRPLRPGMSVEAHVRTR